MSKGSKPRPIKDMDKFRKNWDAIFGSKDQKSKQHEVTDLNWDGHSESRTEEKETKRRSR